VNNNTNAKVVVIDIGLLGENEKNVNIVIRRK
jgi:hypothetical protein